MEVPKGKTEDSGIVRSVKYVIIAKFINQIYKVVLDIYQIYKVVLDISVIKL